MKRNERVFYLDVLRAIACLSVVMIHVSAEFVVRGSSGPDFWLGNLMDSLSRAGVPLFVMISGALMLDENYAFLKEKWIGHILKMVAFYVVWRLVCGWIGSPDYHLWFAPMIAILYLLLPLMRMWVKEENIRSVQWFLALAMAILVAASQGMGWLLRDSDSGFLMSWQNDLNLAFAVRYIVYLVLGWYLNRGLRRWKLVCGLGIFGFLMTFAGTYAAVVVLGMHSYPFYNNFTVNVLMHSVAIFVLCRETLSGAKVSDGFVAKSVRWIGKHSLGIYAVHLYVIAKMFALFGSLHIALSLPLIFAATVMLSGIASMILKHIPIVNRIV